MMKSSKFSGQPKRPPWKPWGGPIHLGNKTLSYENNGVHNSDFEVQPAKSSSFRHQRRVTFENFSHVPRPILLKQQEEKHYEDNIKSRNLGVSHQLLHQFKPKGPRKVILPEKKLISETHSSFRIPGKEKSIPIRHSGYKTIIDMTASTSSSNNANKLLYERDPAQRGEVMHSLDADAVAKIHDMKSQILAGNYVSMTDITALKMKLGRYQEGVFEKPDPLLSSGIPQNIRKRRRIVARKPIFCEKGIVHVPTPHTTQPEINTFGTPADLRYIFFAILFCHMQNICKALRSVDCIFFLH